MKKVKYKKPPTTQELILELRSFYKKQEYIEDKYTRCKSSSILFISKDKKS